MYSLILDFNSKPRFHARFHYKDSERMFYSPIVTYSTVCRNWFCVQLYTQRGPAAVSLIVTILLGGVVWRLTGTNKWVICLACFNGVFSVEVWKLRKFKTQDCFKKCQKKSQLVFVGQVTRLVDYKLKGVGGSSWWFTGGFGLLGHSAFGSPDVQLALFAPLKHLLLLMLICWHILKISKTCFLKLCVDQVECWWLHV